MEWKEVLLSEFLEFNPKRTIKKNEVARKITMDLLIPHSKQIYSFKYEPYTGGAKFSNGDTIMARITPCLENGKHAYVSCLNEGEIAYGSTEYIVLCGKNGVSDNEFVYYLSHTPQFVNTAIKSMVGSSGRQRAQVPVLENLIMPVPVNLSDQRKIAGILSALDAKIENNNKINANLESQAQALFKSWFVDFTPFKDQPFVDSELGPIPQGWKVGTLGEFFPIVTGKKDANISSKSGKYPFFSCSQNISWTNDYSFDGFAIIVAGNGDFNVKWYNGKFEAYQRTYVLIPYNPTLTSWLYYAVKYNLNMITIGARGSVIKFITKGDIQNFKVAYPQNIDKLEIVKMLGKINKDIEHNKNEVSCLAKLRDTLLPKLMSGEIKL